MRRSLIIILAVAALLVFGFIYYALDPSQSGVFPRCTFLTLTGYKCPGCGSQRAIHALMHGDIAGAFRFNALLLISIPWITLCLYAEAQRTRNPRLALPGHGTAVVAPAQHLQLVTTIARKSSQFKV